MFLNDAVVREGQKKSGPGNQTEPLQPNPAKPNLSAKTFEPTTTMLPVFFILNAGYYGNTHTVFSGYEKGSPEEPPCAQLPGRGVPGNLGFL